MTLRVLLADDHAIVRRGVSQLLIERGIASHVFEAETGAQALSYAVQRAVEVELLAMSLPALNGVGVINLKKSQAQRLPAQMMSMFREEEYSVRALNAGAAG